MYKGDYQGARRGSRSSTVWPATTVNVGPLCSRWQQLHRRREDRSGIEELRKQHALARRSAMCWPWRRSRRDRGVLLYAGRLDEASKEFAKALDLVKSAKVGDELKKAAERNYLFNAAQVAARRRTSQRPRRRRGVPIGDRGAELGAPESKPPRAERHDRTGGEAVR